MHNLEVPGSSPGPATINQSLTTFAPVYGAAKLCHNYFEVVGKIGRLVYAVYLKA